MAAATVDYILKNLEAEYANVVESMRPTRDNYVGTIHAHGNSRSIHKGIRRLVQMFAL